MRTSRWICQFLLIVACSGSASEVIAVTEDRAHLQIFLAVPATASLPTELRVRRVELIGEIERHVFEVPSEPFDSEVLRGRVALFVDAAFAPDRIDTLRVVWAGATVRVGGASTQPDIEGTWTDFPLARRFEAGMATVYHLRWDPDATDPAHPDWAPDLRLEEPQLPPIAAMMLVSQEESGTLAIVDRTTNAVAGAIATGGRPRGLAWSDAQQRLYVAVGGRDEIAIVDLGSANVSRRVPLVFGDDPSRVTLSEDGSRLYILCPGRDTLVVLSTASLQELGRLLLEPGVVAIAEQSRTGLVYVSSARARRIAVIDPVTLTIVHVIERSEAPGELVFLERDEGLVVASHEGRSVEVIDPVTGATTSVIALCGPVRGLAYQARTDRLYAVMDLCREVAVLRAARSLEIGRFPLPSSGGLPAIDPEDRTLFVPLAELQCVLRINTSRGRDTLRIETAAKPYQIVIP